MDPDDSAADGRSDARKRQHSKQSAAARPLAQLAATPEEATYFAFVDRFLRDANRLIARRGRAVGVAWGITILLGAGVPFAQALGAPGWVSPTLGFLIVFTQALQHRYAQRTELTIALDTARRALTKQSRLLRAGQPPYDNPGTRLEHFVDCVERIMDVYSERSTDALGESNQPSEREQ